MFFNCDFKSAAWYLQPSVVDYGAQGAVQWKHLDSVALCFHHDMKQCYLIGKRNKHSLYLRFNLPFDNG